MTHMRFPNLFNDAKVTASDNFTVKIKWKLFCRNNISHILT